MKKLKISTAINLHSYRGNHPEEDFADYIRRGLIFLKERGFDAADYSLNWLKFSDDAWRQYIERAIVDSNEIGMKIALCHLPFNSAICLDPSLLPEFNDSVHKAIDAAAMLGVDYAVVHPNTKTKLISEYNEKEVRESVLTHLFPFVEHANRVGVKVVVENMRFVPQPTPAHRYGQTAEELCDIADTLGIGICWDFGHANINGDVQSQEIQKLGSRLKVLHVNDNLCHGDDHMPPFFGNVDWKDAMHGLALIGFDGYLNYEIASAKIPENMREALGKYAYDAAKELMSYIK